MSFLSMAGRFLVFFLSFGGYILWLKERFGLKPEFAPVVICSGIGSIIFLAGILNILPLTVILLFLFGLFQLRRLVKIKKYLSDRRFIILSVIFGICCVYFAFYMRGIMFTHYDNFSHWAVAAKEILRTDNFPNFESVLINFQAYPLGSAGFIYYVCRIIGDTEGCMAFAQCLILISCVFVFFAFLNKKNIYLLFLIFVSGLYFFTANIFITDLLVDTMIPLLGLASVAIAYYYRYCMNKAVLFTAPVFIFLVCVKNSSIYFWIVGLLFIFYISFKHRNIKQILKPFLLISVLLPSGIIYLWNRHVNYVFSNAMSSKHAMSLGSYLGIFREKTKDDIFLIIKNFMARTFSFDNEVIQILILSLVILAIGYLLTRKKGKKFFSCVEPQIFLLCIGVYFAYMISLLCMYLFSMHMSEAGSIDSYERYSQTIALFIYGILLLYMLSYFPLLKSKNIIKTISYVLICVIFTGFLWNHRKNVKDLFVRPDFSDTPRYYAEYLKKEYGIHEGKKYFIYMSLDQNTKGYYEYMFKYMMSSICVTAWSAEDLYNKEIDIYDYDYLIFCTRDDTLETFLRKNGLSLTDDVIVIP